MPSKLIATTFCKIIIDPLGQGAHYFVIFFIINTEQIIVYSFPGRQKPHEEVLQK